MDKSRFSAESFETTVVQVVNFLLIKEGQTVIDGAGFRSLHRKRIKASSSPHINKMAVDKSY